MKFEFTGEEIAAGLNKVEIEDVEFSADFVEGEGTSYGMTGTAVIEGETYRDFRVEFETAGIPKNAATAAGILAEDWTEYDFVFEV